MANVTYAQLSEATDVADTDLLASYRSSGPLKRLAASTYRDYLGQTGGFLKLDASNGPLTGQLQVDPGSAGSPAIVAADDADSGIYFVPGPKIVGVAINGSPSSWNDPDGFNIARSLNYPAVQDIASAATTSIGDVTSSYARITGTTTITSLGSADVGVVRYVRMAGALTLTHNATSLILPGGANITTAAGDMFKATSEGSSNWRVEWYTKANGQPVAGGTTEGPWTPTISFSTPGTSSFTYATQYGAYQRTGNWVRLDFYLNFTPTIGTGSGAVLINGVPVAVMSGDALTAASGIVGLLGSTWVTYSGALSLNFNTATTLKISFTATGSGSTAFTPTQMTGGVAHIITGSIYYRVA